jgi:FkbM family methyltransferase
MIGPGMHSLLRAFRRHKARIPGRRTRPPQGVYVGGGRVLTTTVYGQRLFVDARDLSLSPGLILDGCWEPNVTRALISLVKPGMTVVEIGANVGYFTTQLGRRVGGQGSVRAFEANPAVFDLLTENIDINGLVPIVRAEPMLVCDSCGEREINLLERHRGSGSMLAFGDEFLAMYHDKKTTITVPATTLDEYWRDERRPVDLVKMDAEGSEPMIVDGMRGILAQPHLTVVCEFVKPFFAGREPSAEDFLEALLAYGFALFKITDRGDIAPVSSREVLVGPDSVELVFTK